MEQNNGVFEFVSYQIHSDNKSIDFRFKSEGQEFVEIISLPQVIPSTVNQDLLKRVLENLHLILGISYYKSKLLKTIKIPYELSREQASFWNRVYTKGLGELFFRNNLDFRGLINFPYGNAKSASPIKQSFKSRGLVGIGGGKDSIVTLELLKGDKMEMTGLILETGASGVQQNVAKMGEIDYLLVKRRLDERLLKLSVGYRGHVPFSAIYAFIALLVATAYDYSEIITSNEKSANFGNVEYLGETINHQWSKSEEFENMFKEYVNRYITEGITYLSYLRGYSEMEIVKLFSNYKKYFPVFSSCNTNFKIKGKSETGLWCGKCPKCAFVFATLGAYLSKQELLFIFKTNMLSDAKLTSLYRDLIGKGTMKPFECVGTFDETLEALRMIREKGEFNDDAIMKEISPLL